MSVHYPQRWHVEEFKFNQALGWHRAGTLNLNIRYGHMTLALVAQTVVVKLNRNLGTLPGIWTPPTSLRTSSAVWKGTCACRTGMTIVVTYYNAPNLEQLRQHYEHLPAKLTAQKVNPSIPWLYNFKLDFRFK